jgi:hypothetical protein
VKFLVRKEKDMGKFSMVWPISPVCLGSYISFTLSREYNNIPHFPFGIESAMVATGFATPTACRGFTR